MSWQPYAAREGSTVTGTLLQWEGVGDARHAARTVLAWLPPSYRSQPEKRYPVVYLHDGQNVFDTATSYNLSEWGADETLTTLAAEGLEVIAIGIPNANERRYHEYSPQRHPEFPPEVEGGGGGDDYLDFLIKTIKPLADDNLRTRPDAAHTFLLGSSMGGLISLHALLTRPDVFGGAGVMSPAFWACAGEAFDRVRNSPPIMGKVWLDIGGEEGTDHPEQQQAYWDDAHAMRDLLLERGLGKRLRFEADPQGIHRETAWRERLPRALRFLLEP